MEWEWLDVAAVTVKKAIREFLAGDISLCEFMKAQEMFLGTEMDPIDTNLPLLPDEHQAFVAAFCDFFGGQFGRGDKIPFRGDWKYSESSDLYGWIDQTELKRLLQAEIGKYI